MNNPAWTLGDDVKPGPLIDVEIQLRIVGVEQVQQQRAHIGDGDGQALAKAGVLFQGSLAGNHLVIFS